MEGRLNRRRRLIMIVVTGIVFIYAGILCIYVHNSAIRWSTAILLGAVLIGGFLYDRCYQSYTEELLTRLSLMLASIHDGQREETFLSLEDTMYAKLQTQTTNLTNLLIKSKEESENSRNEMKGLVSDIAHQLKTPLAVLRMYSDFLKDDTLTEEEREETLQVLYATISKMEFLIESMIKMSRLESGVISLHPENASLNDTVFTAIAQVRKKAVDKEVDISFAGEANIMIMHDVGWTAEALFNILENGVKYNKQGGRINVTILPYEMFCRVDIEDDGVGIEEAEIPKIFQRFYRGKEGRNVEGVGIGLYLTRQIITMQGGYIKVTSKGKNQGTKFSVFLAMNR